MSPHFGQFHIKDDPLHDVHVIEWQPPKFSMAVTHHSLFATVTPAAQYMVDHVASAMIQEYRMQLIRHIEEWWLNYTASKSGLYVSPKVKKELEANPKTAAPANLPPSFASLMKDEFHTSPWQTALAQIVNEAAIFNGSHAFEPVDSIDVVLEKGIPGFHKMRQPCPVPKCLGHMSKMPTEYLRDTIIHLNDQHGWTRERIADWLETLDHDLRFKVPGGGEEDGNDH